MSLWFPRRSQSSKKRNPVRPRLESLEDRCTPTNNTISGFVYQDANNNGIFDPGEIPIANSPIQLRNAANQVVGSTTTNAQGFYIFDHDDTIGTAPVTLTKTVNFQDTQTDFSLSGLLDQFNPDLGELQSVEISHSGSITSEIKVENISTQSGSTIVGTISGNLTLTAPSVNNPLSLNKNIGNVTASVFDGDINFSGTSGTSFGAKTASGSNTLTLTGSSINAYIGGGTVTVQETGTATSVATGGGNLVMNVISSGAATVTVVYKYIPSNRLKPGNYVIIQTTQPAGLLDGLDAKNGVPMAGSVGTDTIPVTLVASDVPNNNFGELPPPQLSGFVWHDVSNDAIRDGNESGIAGVTVTLTGTDDLGPVSKTSTTDANGFYQFLNLRPGTYTVTESQPATWMDGKDAAGSKGGNVGNDVIANVVLPAGVSSINNNFGELKPAAISGFVYVDANNNGVKDAFETPIGGVTVNLSGTTADGGVSLQTTTDGSGFYSFTNLKPGTYGVQEAQPATYLDGKDSVGSLNGVLANDQITGIPLASAANGQNYNFGELNAASIAGNVYVDANNNGVKEPGEAAIGNVTVTLSGVDDLGNSVSKPTTTDGNGAYSFTNLRPGTYGVLETQPSAYFDGKDAVGSLNGSLGNDQLTSITVPVGANGQNYNFGEVLPASLNGYVYVDANNSGSKDPGEAPIGGVTLNLSGIDDLGNSVSRTTTTDAGGAYSFTNLRQGNYSIQESQPTAYFDGKDSVGTLSGALGNDQVAAIQVPAGANGQNYNFGEVLPGSLSGFVYADANNNGVKEPGEAPIGGVLITLSGSDDASNGVSRTATTDGNGFYQFTNLRAGNYVLTENQPANFIDGKDTIGTPGGQRGNDMFTGIVLLPSVNGANNNFGELPSAGLSGFVYVDANDNGVKEASEAGISGVAVTLTGSDDVGVVNLTAYTDATGFYRFPNLRPGNYTITESQPSSHNDGKDTIGTPGGLASNDQFSNIFLAAAVLGANNNFGELNPDNSDLKVVKTVNVPVAQVGDLLTYTITVTNLGAYVAKDVVLTDDLPTGATVVSTSGAGWFISTGGGLMTATRPSLAVNAPSVITLIINVPPVTSTLTNHVHVSSSTPDYNPLNNDSTVTTPVTPPTKDIPVLATKVVRLPITGKKQLIGNANQAPIVAANEARLLFIDGVYQTLLGRSPTAAEASSRLTRLQKNVAREVIVREIWISAEHRALQAVQLYETFLGRMPTTKEKTAMVAQLNKGVQENALSAQLMGSSEFVKKYTSPGALAGGLYLSTQGALPDLTTHANLVQSMSNQTVTAAALALLKSQAGLQNTVDDIYRQMLYRPASASEMQVNAAQVSANKQSDLAIKLLASAEFYQLAQDSKIT